MNEEPIIKSLLDTDLYKYTMSQAVWGRYPEAHAGYRYRCRKGKDLPEGREREFLHDLEREVAHFCSLGHTGAELDYLFGLGFFKPGFLEFLRLFRPNPDFVKWEMNASGGLSLTVEGSWYASIFFEVPLLAIISELHTRYESSGPPDFTEARKRLSGKIETLKSYNCSVKGSPCRFVDFGTRRRACFAWENELTAIIKREIPECFAGTSNLHLAMIHELPAAGTMAHEWLQAHQQLDVHPRESQKEALMAWASEYRGKLGIALSDVLGFDAFLADFDPFLAKLYDGCRHDSGDPVAWCEKLIAHYESLGIDPASKTAVFSDSLTFPVMIELHRRFSGRIKTAFGIGTNLTNDTGIAPLDIVIKMVSVNGRPVAKISDSPGKGMCDDGAYLAWLKGLFGITGTSPSKNANCGVALHRF
ncbi:MAG: nicotinate phosphoribosyltransferase [Deltaproteobacteria bacterium]|nr:nicotinate phosphoribosyltransferase [Deltaproteobacteria bacterium]